MQHNRVQCMKKIANYFCNLLNQQKEHVAALLQHQTSIMQREGVQKRFADLKQRLEEAQVL